MGMTQSDRSITQIDPFLFTKICDSLQNPEFSLLYRF